MKKLLIEDGLPFEAINEASHREKSGTGANHPRRLHIWWARRPLAMSRAIVLGSLLPAPNTEIERKRQFAAIAAASMFQDVGRPAAIEPLRAMVKEAFPDADPRVLDSFAGGGSIPLEALRLGCETTAVDLNPIAHLVERCLLEFPQALSGGDGERLADSVSRWGKWVEDRVQSNVAPAFARDPDGRVPNVWFWARTMRCANPSCGVEFPLVKTWWLANGRRGTRVWMRPMLRGDRYEVEIRDGPPLRDFDPANGTVRASSATCPACGTTSSAAEMRKYGMSTGFREQLLAKLVGDRKAGEYVYRPSTVEDLTALAWCDERLQSLPDAPEGLAAVPDEETDPAQARKFSYLIYGLSRYGELFNARQALVAAQFCEEIRSAHAAMLAEGADPYRARAVATYVSLVVSRLVDFNSTFSSWGVTREMSRNTFARQSIPMIWDYVEINPFSDVPGNWYSGVRAAAAVIDHCQLTGRRPATVIRGDAQALTMFPDASFDAVVVDPPYYDAMQYADLSDYFYVWQKRALGSMYPELFATPRTPKSQEVIENRADRRSSSYISSEEFERRLSRAIQEMRRVVRPDGAVTIVFAHTEADAWERLLRALHGAGLLVSTSWPMRSEMATRSTANLSAVLGSSVVLVCRPRVASAVAFYDDVVRELDVRIGERLDEFERLGLQGADYLISAIGPAFEVFGKYTAVQRLNGEAVAVGELLALARRTVARHAMRRLLGSEALAAVDDVSLFYLTWRWAYGSARIPVDEAQKLGKAFNVEAHELDGVDGLVDTSRDSYGLRGPDDRKRIKLGVSPTLVDVVHVSCKLFEQGRRSELAEVLAGSGFAEEPAFWASARAIAESLPDGDRERTLLVNFLGGQSQTVEAARHASPSEVLRLFEVET